MIPRARYALAAAVIAMLITGCSSDEEGTAPMPSTTPQTTTQTQDTAVKPPMQSPEEDEHAHEEPELPPLATWDAAAEQQALGQAEGFVRSYARPNLIAADWFSGIAGYLSPSAIESYAYTDPAFIPATTVNGDPQVIGAPTGTSVSVAVPTDAGELHVHLVRAFASESWLVSTLEMSSEQ